MADDASSESEADLEDPEDADLKWKKAQKEFGPHFWNLGNFSDLSGLEDEDDPLIRELLQETIE